jgi:hypothetical protein
MIVEKNIKKRPLSFSGLKSREENAQGEGVIR